MRNRDQPLYLTWKMMRQRCNNPRFPKYPRYGGRGITICPEWDNFHRFMDDMGLRPDGYTLNRIDNDGPYSKENCNWATPKEQAANRAPRHDHRLMTLDGVTKHQAEWGKELGLLDATIHRRRNLGWPDHKILTTPVDKRFDKTRYIPKPLSPVL